MTAVEVANVVHFSNTAAWAARTACTSSDVPYTPEEGKNRSHVNKTDIRGV
jgi:hypothetical protein